MHCRTGILPVASVGALPRCPLCASLPPATAAHWLADRVDRPDHAGPSPLSSRRVNTDVLKMSGGGIRSLAVRRGADRRETTRRWLLTLMLAMAPFCGSAAPADPSQGPAHTGLVSGDVYLRHHTGLGHPERPERLTAILARLEQSNLLARLVPIPPTPASTDWIAKVHHPDYIRRVAADCRDGVGYVDSPDAPASTDSYDVAIHAAGGVLAAVDAVIQGKVRNAFCAVRPPGHHALTNRAMGFCLFNNVAIAARYLQSKHKLARVLIVDWDVHHGNGTQAAFYADPTVLYFSTHQFPFYPGTGSATETGEANGRGFTLNAPLPPGTDDAQYQRVFQTVLQPAAAAFRPDFLLVSAGFDAAEGDLLGAMRLTPEGFATLTRIVKQIADEQCQGRLVTVLEGGYHLDRLAACVEAHIRALIE